MADAHGPRRRDALAEDFERDLHTEHQILNMGPSHPATHGTVKFLIELDGETIVDLDVQVGYLHRGFEKECEAGPGTRRFPTPTASTTTPPSSPTSATAWRSRSCSALETPERCQWLRVLGGELARIADHLTRCGAACLELAAMTPFLYGIEARELGLGSAGEPLRRARHLELRPHRRRQARHAGGLPRPVPRGRSRRSASSCATSTTSSPRNRIFVDRLKETGVISKEDCLRYAVTGPILRSTGVPLDVRKAEPYLVYDRDRLRRPGRRGGRQLRPLPRAASRRCTRACASSSSASTSSRSSARARSTRARPARALAGQGPGLQPHGGADPAVQVGDRGAARAGRRGLLRHRVGQRGARLLPGLRRLGRAL